MAEGEGLSRAFAERHPEEAARLLEALPASEVAAYLAELPVSVAAPVAAAMLPVPAAAVLDEMRGETGGALLATLGPDRAAALLRCLAPERREAWLRRLRRLRPGRRAAVGLLLSYPVDTVGAWTEPRILSLRRDATVAWARRAVATVATAAESDLYVVDADRRLAGWLPVGRLLRSGAQARLDQVMDRQPAVLPAATGIGEARADHGWVGRTALPVVDGRGQLLGAVSESALDRAMGGGQGRELVAGDSTLGALTDAYLHAGAGLLRGVWGLLAPAGASRGEDSR